MRVQRKSAEDWNRVVKVDRVMVGDAFPEHEVFVESHIGAAIEGIQKITSENSHRDMVALVTGSFHLVGGVMKWLNIPVHSR